MVIGYFGQRLFAQVVSVPLRLILPAVCFLCVLDAFLQGGGIIGVNIMLVFGIIGFIAKKFDFSFVTFLIGFVIGPSFELTLRQSVALTGHSFLKLADHPIAILIFILTFITIWRFAVSKLKK